MRVIRDRTVAQKLDVSRNTVWRWAREDPKFPKPIRVSAGVSAWIESEIDAYLEARAGERDLQAAA